MPVLVPVLTVANRRQFQVSLVHTLNLLPGLFERAVIADNVVGNGEPLFPAGLRSDDTTSLCFGFGVTSQKTPDLLLHGTVDDQYAIHRVSKRRFDQ